MGQTDSDTVQTYPAADITGRIVLEQSNIYYVNI